jgi:hypothetical protein
MSNAQQNPNDQNPCLPAGRRKTKDLVIGIYDLVGPWDLVIGALVTICHFDF